MNVSDIQVDHSRHSLGKPCKFGHVDAATGQTWRHAKAAKDKCVQCHPENAICPVCGVSFYALAKVKMCSSRCYGVQRAQDSESRLNRTAFDVWTPDMAYALGLVHTDGCLHRPVGQAWGVSFANTDLATVQWWHSFVGSPRTIYSRTPSNNDKNYTAKNGHKEIHSSACTSEYLGERLVELGMRPRKSWGDMHIPDMPVDCLPHYLRGLIDGDGCISLTKIPTRVGLRLCVVLISNSETFRKELCDLYAKQGWRPSNRKIQVGLRGSDAEELCQWIYGTGGPCMTRKYQVWLRYQDTLKSFGGLLCEMKGQHREGRYTQTWKDPKPWQDLLGKCSDAEIAKSAGVTASCVAWVRVKRGIASYKATRQTEATDCVRTPHRS